MPFYRFVCQKCSYEEKKLLPQARLATYEPECIKCHVPLLLVFGVPLTRSLETIDSYRDKKTVENVSKMLDDRAKEHFNKHDLPRIIAEHGIEFAKRQGFVDQDGKPR